MLDDIIGDVDAVGLIVQAQQRPGMPLGQIVAADQLHILLRQPQQPQLVRNGRLGLPYLARGLLLCQTELLDEPLEAIRLLKEIQIAPLQILNEGDHRRVLPVRVDEQAGYIGQSGDARRPQPPLPCDQFIATVPCPPHGQRIEHAVLTDTLCERGDRLRVEISPRLIGIAHDL